MSEQTLEIDWTRCDGHGLCADLVPDRIVMDGQVPHPPRDRQ